MFGGRADKTYKGSDIGGDGSLRLLIERRKRLYVRGVCVSVRLLMISILLLLYT